MLQKHGFRVCMSPFEVLQRLSGLPAVAGADVDDINANGVIPSTAGCSGALVLVGTEGCIGTCVS